MIVGARSLKGGGRYFTVGMVLAIVGVVLNVIAVGQALSGISGYSSILSLIAFLLVSISYTLKQVVFGTELNTNRLVGAICVFLLLGVIWALAYVFVELELVPRRRFKGIEPGARQRVGQRLDLLQFRYPDDPRIR